MLPIGRSAQDIAVVGPQCVAAGPLAVVTDYPGEVANERRRARWRATSIAAAMIALSACTPAGFISGWVPYWNAPQGRVAYMNPDATPMFKDISPFFFSAQPDGTIVLVGASGQLTTTVHEAHIRNLTVLPSITDGSGRLTMTTILADPATRAQHIANIVSLVDRYPEIDGVDLDYEGFAFADGHDSWATTQPRWRAFVSELAAALHAKSKLLSVTIPPTWVGPGGVTGYPVYDQGAIAVDADRIRLMVYDWSVSSPGPISPISWVSQVIAYSNAVLPNYKSKVQLGVPAYGRNWGRKLNASEICPDGALKTTSIELENMQALINAQRATPSRHVSGEMTFTYDTIATGFSSVPIPAPPYVPSPNVLATLANSADGNAGGLQPALRLTPPGEELSCTVRHDVYYPDATTIRQHAQAARDAGWSGVVIWALGYETDAVYRELANTTP
jgi:spore germination protein YaaH